MNKNIIILAAVLMTACAPAVQLADSSIELPGDYGTGHAADTSSIADLGWRDFFPDTLLQRHIQEALDSNLSYRSCVERMALAANELRASKFGYAPSVSAGLTAGLERFGDYTMDGVGNATTNTPDLDKSKHIPSPYSDFGLGVSFSWEVDIYGKQTQKKRAAFHRWMASKEAAALAHSILVSEVAMNYFDLVSLDVKKNAIIGAINFIESAYDLTEELKNAGEINQLAVDQFNSRYLELQGMFLENENSIRAKERALCMLLGKFPGHIERSGFHELVSHEYLTDAGIPDSLLTRRPDIKEAELLLAAADCDIRAARRAFYPGLQIGGAGGFNAFDITRMFMAPASLVYNLVAGLSAPILDAGRVRKSYLDAVAMRNMAVNNYKETVLEAYSEVSGLMESAENYTRRIELKKEEMMAGKNASSAATDLFRMQFIGYLEVLSADSDYFDCCNSYIDLVIEKMKIQASLYRALGGGTE